MLASILSKMYEVSRLGFKDALESAGIAFDPELMVDSGYDREGGERGIDQLLSLARRPTAVFATNHLVAAGAMFGAQRRGLAVPDDLSVASFYDAPVAELLNPTVTRLVCA